MKAPRNIIRAVSLLLFIVLALQLTGATCYGEKLTIESSNTQVAHQVVHATPDSHDASKHSPVDLYDSFHCPCHGNFTQPASITLTFHTSIVVAYALPDHFFFENISTRLFQPPRTIL